MVSAKETCALGIVLVVSMVAIGCGSTADQKSDQLGPKALARCGARGAPVTLAKLVRVFRVNGITLEINQSACHRTDLTEPDATNGGPNGLRESKETERREGFVLCDVRSNNVGRSVRVVKYATDNETYLSVLNVNCSVYPYDAAHEKRQISRVRKALEAVIRATPKTG